MFIKCFADSVQPRKGALSIIVSSLRLFFLLQKLGLESVGQKIRARSQDSESD